LRHRLVDEVAGDIAWRPRWFTDQHQRLGVGDVGREPIDILDGVVPDDMGLFQMITSWLSSLAGSTPGSRTVSW